MTNIPTVLPAIIALLISGIGAARAETIAFGNDAVGGLPANFETGLTGNGDEGRWEIVEDPSAEGGRALAQLSPDDTNNRYPLAIYTPVSAANVNVQARFKAISGEVDQAGGVVLRLADENNYYIARANALEGNVRFYRVEDGDRDQLESARVEVTLGEWHTLGLRGEGDRFTVTYDGDELFVVEDDTFSGPGKVGFWTKADSITHFDQLQIEVLE